MSSEDDMEHPSPLRRVPRFVMYRMHRSQPPRVFIDTLTKGSAMRPPFSFSHANPKTVMRLMELLPRVAREALLDADAALREVVAVNLALEFVRHVRLVASGQWQQDHTISALDAELAEYMQRRFVVPQQLLQKTSTAQSELALLLVDAAVNADPSLRQPDGLVAVPCLHMGKLADWVVGLRQFATRPCCVVLSGLRLLSAVGLNATRDSELRHTSPSGNGRLRHTGPGPTPHTTLKFSQKVACRFVSVQDEQGWNALHRAASEEHVGCMDFVMTSVDGGKDLLDVPTASGATPLHLAAEFGAVMSVTRLIDYGASLDVMDTAGSHNMNPTVQRGYGFTPLLMALRQGGGSRNEACAQALITAGANVHHSCPDFPFWAPLHLAAHFGLADVVNMLLDAGARIETTDANERTPLHVAAEAGRANCIPALLDAGARGRRLDSFGWAPMHIAAWYGQAACIEALHRGGMNVNVLDRDQNTPLDIATQRGHAACVASLLKAGATLKSA